MLPPALFVIATTLSALSASGGESGEQEYVEDFEFLQRTVAQSGASVSYRKIDWKKVCKAHRPRFKACTNDRDHVENVMRLLAELGDAHTGVTRATVSWDELPSKFDGLYGGGMDFAWDDGRVWVRGVMDGHVLGTSVPPGAALVAVDGVPAWLAMERERQRCAGFQGISTAHSFFSSLSNRFLPFGEAQQVEALFWLPERDKWKRADVPRWGPGGRAYSPSRASLPEGVEWKQGATSAWLDEEGFRKLGYLRITGSMNAATVQAFDAAFDELEGAEAILLDCRWMGGGSDDSAWNMCARFFTETTRNGNQRSIEPRGSWQFDGPVVMLQNESEVSSAETFTWAMCETGRVISVGRPTGGWGIIPRGFQCPSGLVDFRLGVNARATPITRKQTEGVGWMPDLLVPYGPVFCSLDDATRLVGLQVLRVLAAGAPGKSRREAVLEAFRGLLAGEVKGWRKDARKLGKKAAGWNPRELERLVLADLERELQIEIALLSASEHPLPDVLGASRRLEELAPRARSAGLETLAGKLAKALKSLAAEARAQEALVALAGAGFDATPDEREAFLARHRKTRTGRFAEEVLWSE